MAVCPTGALTEADETGAVIRALSDPTKTVIVQTAPAVRAALGEEFGMPAGTLVTGKMVAALRRLGFDYVFDTDFAADLTILEEGTELLNRLSAYMAGDPNVKLPILTSCCPAWVKFFEHQFPEMKDIPSSARSPQQMFGSIAKTYFAEKIGVKRENLVVVSIMPCLAKKYESSRPEFAVNGNPDVDFALSTRELAHLINLGNVDFNSLPNEEFDAPLGESTGAAVIFGTTGGVLLKPLCEQLMKSLQVNHFHVSILKNYAAWKGFAKRPSISTERQFISVLHTDWAMRGSCSKIFRTETASFMPSKLCRAPGGCIGGGGQPYHHGDAEILKKRQRAIYSEDKSKAIRKSHENPYITKLYEEFLGAPDERKGASSAAHQIF